MTEHTTHLDTGYDSILNLDTDEDANFIAITENKTVFTNFEKLKLEQKFSFPIIRRIDSNSFLLADSRSEGGDVNAYIFDFTGHLKHSFIAGDGIEDIVIQNSKIVITYFDEGVFGDDGPNNEGLAVFDLSGKLIFGFNSSKNSTHIYDCYCVCKLETNKLAFYAYSNAQADFSLCELNIETLKAEELDIPIDFKGAQAISFKQDIFYLHASYNYKQSFFRWAKGEISAPTCGNYSSTLKGITNGKFFSYGTTGFTIVDPTE